MRRRGKTVCKRPHKGLTTGWLIVVAAVGGLLSAAGWAEVNPFAPPEKADYVPGAAYLSDGSILIGQIRLTRGKSLHVWLPAQSRRPQFPLSALKEIRVEVAKVRMENEWRFEQSGSPKKVYTGRTYPRLDYAFTLVLNDGRIMQPELAQGAPVYILPEESAKGERDVRKDKMPRSAPARPKRRPVRLLLQPFTKGKPGQDPGDVLHIQRIVLGKGAKAEALAEMARRRRAQKAGQEKAQQPSRSGDEIVPAPAPEPTGKEERDKPSKGASER